MNSIKEHSRNTGKLYFSLFFKDNKKPWFKNHKASRFFVVTINRLRANHYNLPESLARINIIDNSRCACGSEKADVSHILWQCDNLDDQRRDLTNNLAKININPPHNIESLIEGPNMNACHYVIYFVKNCKLQI